MQDFVPKKHLARFILGLVRESLDLKEIKSSYPSTLGQRLVTQQGSLPEGSLPEM